MVLVVLGGVPQVWKLVRDGLAYLKGSNHGMVLENMNLAVRTELWLSPFSDLSGIRDGNGLCRLTRKGHSGWTGRPTSALCSQSHSSLPQVQMLNSSRSISMAVAPMGCSILGSEADHWP
jgi:hypothetical protein